MTLAYDFDTDAPETAPAISVHGMMPYSRPFPEPASLPPRPAGFANAGSYAIYDPLTRRAYLPEKFDLLGLPVTNPHFMLEPNWHKPAVGGAAAAITQAQTSWLIDDPSSATVKYFGGGFSPFNSLCVDSSTTNSLTMATVIENDANTFDLIVQMKVRDSLVGYEGYSTGNWDSYDAEPITAETLAAARRFISMLPTTLGDPEIAPGANGTIALEWIFTDRSLRKLFIDVGPKSIWSGYWRMVDGRKGTIGPSTIGLTTQTELKDLFKALE